MPKSILIIEDEKSIQNILRAFLEDAGYSVTLADDGIVGIDIFHKIQPDLVLLDLMLPKIDGFVVCEIIRKESSIPIIMLTALDDDDSQIKGFDVMADDYITKPFSMPLVVCCTSIYLLVLYFLPKNYQSELENQFTAGFQDLAAQLEKDGLDGSTQTLLDFSTKNSAAVRIVDEDEQEVFSVNATVESDVSGQPVGASSSFIAGGKTYFLYATATFIAVSQSYDILLKLLPFIVAIILFVSIIGAYICSHNFSKPLINICNVAKRLTQLDMTWKCDTSREDEIGELAIGLNEMSTRLNDALCSLQTANEQLRLDIENERKQEKQRIDFFTAISHELKTPITIMKGNLEGMIYQVGDYKDRDTYLRYSLKTANEMELLVKEIMEAAKMGGSDFQLKISNLNVSDMVVESCHKLAGLAEDKGIVVQWKIQPCFNYMGDRRLLQKVFSNIIGNAIIYFPEKENVSVILQNSMLSVENTGIHIEQKDLDQIFVPFYRVDKSHNRNTGGSGLGLYIVKTILDHHECPYRIENTEKGVKFSIFFS